MSYSDKIKYIVATLSIVPAIEIDKDDALALIGIDSLKIVELIIAIEDDFKLKFDDSDLDPGQLTTVGSIILLVEKYLGKVE